jgi:methylated-DNA-protein-cysteine methyltransferase-like protein
MHDKENFSQAIMDVVKHIPPGRATSYGAIARAIGYPNMSRMVGKIMGTCNSAQTEIPSHRVVNAQGILSGKDSFGAGLEMQHLLEAEGIVIKNNRILHWKNVFWDPIREIVPE